MIPVIKPVTVFLIVAAPVMQAFYGIIPLIVYKQNIAVIDFGLYRSNAL